MSKNLDWLGDFGRYLVAGGTAFVVDYVALFALSVQMKMHYLLAASSSFLAGAAVAYLICTAWVFQFRPIANRSLEFWLFVAIGVVGLGLNALVLWVLTGNLGVHLMFAKIFAAALVLAFNFGARRALIFVPADRIGSMRGSEARA